jgi:hypothetical protein
VHKPVDLAAFPKSQLPIVRLRACVCVCVYVVSVCVLCVCDECRRFGGGGPVMEVKTGPSGDVNWDVSPALEICWRASRHGNAFKKTLLDDSDSQPRHVWKRADSILSRESALRWIPSAVGINGRSTQERFHGKTAWDAGPQFIALNDRKSSHGGAGRER